MQSCGTDHNHSVEDLSEAEGVTLRQKRTLQTQVAFVLRNAHDVDGLEYQENMGFRILQWTAGAERLDLAQVQNGLQGGQVES